MEDFYQDKSGAKFNQKIPLDWLRDNRRIFNEIAGEFGTVPRCTGLIGVRNKIREKTGDLIVYKNNLLDVGVGNGMLFPYLKKKVIYVGVDISDKMLGLAEEKARKYSFSFIPVLRDATNLSFSDDSFDTTVCIDTFHHIPAQFSNKVLDELFRVTKPNGQILLEIKNRFNILLNYQYRRTYKNKGLVMNPINPLRIKHYFEKKNCTMKAYFPMGFHWFSPFILFDIRLSDKE